MYIGVCTAIKVYKGCTTGVIRCCVHTSLRRTFTVIVHNGEATPCELARLHALDTGDEFAILDASAPVFVDVP